MAIQVSTIASATTPTTSRAGVLYAQHSTHKEKVSLQSSKGPKRSISSLSSFSSYTTFHSTGRNNRGTRFICEAKNAVNEVLVATDKNWNELVTESPIPVMAEFWAPWCGPCRMIAPVVDDLAKEMAGKALFVKVNTDDCPTIATRYGVRSIPTVLVFKDGEKKDSIIGAVQKSALSSTIEKYVGM